MKPVIDTTKEYGLVLEGGGAKGAYQIGAWKALKEANIRIKGIAGTSVGALNGALICMGDLEKAESLWENISYSQIMSVDDKIMEDIFKQKKISRDALKDMMDYISDGGVDITPLKELIAECVDEEKIQNSPMDLYIHTFSVDEMRELNVDLKEIEPELIKDFLLASSYIFPIFKSEKLHGKTYIDGGAINNVPVDTLIEKEYKDIIIVRIFGIGREKKVKIPEDMTIYTIAPTVSLGSILDFNPKKSKMHLKRGYFDTMRVLYGLAGKIYYIDEQEKECYYLSQLTELSQDIYAYLTDVYKLELQESREVRNLTEVILPVIAEEMKLSKDWSYKELYLSILEATAKICRIQKYKIYTLQELQDKVREKLLTLEGEELPAFVQIISKDRFL
ncbi:patatin-like phospholipase family protein [Lachnospiraceae bacterium AM25-40]|nr:patatin-like phospholipase family protein [Lachnospiraceae bacterium AM25-22]RJW10109.1 patatin-like phospholipase family protein [Lachnospiraceae bacterium AM25-40]